MLFAKVILYGPEHDGRTSVAAAGYHPQLRVGEEYTSCFIYPCDRDIEVLNLNTEYLVTLRLLLPEFYQHQLQAGQVLEFYEGSKKVGRGIVLDQLTAARMRLLHVLMQYRSA